MLKFQPWWTGAMMAVVTEHCCRGIRLDLILPWPALTNWEQIAGIKRAVLRRQLVASLCGIYRREAQLSQPCGVGLDIARGCE